jgi:hypothetical protein
MCCCWNSSRAGCLELLMSKSETQLSSLELHCNAPGSSLELFTHGTVPQYYPHITATIATLRFLEFCSTKEDGSPHVSKGRQLILILSMAKHIIILIHSYLNVHSSQPINLKVNCAQAVFLLFLFGFPFIKAAPCKTDFFPMMFITKE